jgi:hypothetical protein
MGILSRRSLTKAAGPSTLPLRRAKEKIDQIENITLEAVS